MITQAVPNMNTSDSLPPPASTKADLIKSVVGDAPPAEVAAVAELGESLGEVLSPPLGEAPPAPAGPTTETVPVAPAGEPAAAPTEVETLRRQNADLWARMEQMSQAVLTQQQQVAPPTAAPPVEAPVYVAPVIPISHAEKQQFVTQENFVKAFESAEAFNELLNKVMQATQQAALTRVLPAMSETAREEVRRYSLSAEFFRNNPELVTHKATVGYIANSVKTQNPTFTDEQVLVETAKICKGMQAAGQMNGTAATGAAPPAGRAALPTVSGTRTPTGPTLTKQQQLIKSIL